MKKSKFYIIKIGQLNFAFNNPNIIDLLKAVEIKNADQIIYDEGFRILYKGAVIPLIDINLFCNVKESIMHDINSILILKTYYNKKFILMGIPVDEVIEFTTLNDFAPTQPVMGALRLFCKHSFFWKEQLINIIDLKMIIEWQMNKHIRDSKVTQS
jgi:chemotaxis signal transduction protein